MFVCEVRDNYLCRLQGQTAFGHVLPRAFHKCPPIDCMHSTLPAGHETLIYYVIRVLPHDGIYSLTPLHVLSYISHERGWPNYLQISIYKWYISPCVN